MSSSNLLMLAACLVGAALCGRVGCREQQEVEARLNELHLNHSKLADDGPALGKLNLEADISVPPDLKRKLEQAPKLYLYHLDELHGKVSVSEVGLMALETKLRSSFYSDMFTQKYDTYHELRLANGPEVNQEACLSHLEHLVQRAKRQLAEGVQSRDINLYRLMDTYGRLPAGSLNGDAFWPGEYEQCRRLKITLDAEGKQVGTRYCTASLRASTWPDYLGVQEPELEDMRSLKAGLCLPASCDSSRHKNKYELIARLFDYQSRAVERNQAKLHDLFCLPDERSPLRSWRRSPATLSCVVALGCWVAFLLYATFRYERLRSKLRESSVGSQLERQNSFGLSNGLKIDDSNSDHLLQKQQVDMSHIDPNFKLYKTLAITSNLKLLFDTSSTSSLMDTGRKMEAKSSADQMPTVSTKAEVDLRIIEGIKVLSTFYVITGHVLMVITTVISNGRELAYTSSPAYQLANLMPAFAVNSFFVITGLLTSYLLFKQNESHSFINNPAKWLALIIYRYLRIMPMYLLTIVYTKHLAKFTSSGPFWDYATSSIAQRKMCEQESWWWVLTFTANFKSPLEHCIPSAWYLANDFQFFIVTPIFLALLHKSPAFGKWVLRVSILIGYLIGIFGIMSSSASNFIPIATFAPNGFKFYVEHLAFSYTQPHHRIPAYLLGLLIGYSLHCYARAKASASKHEVQVQKDENSNDILEEDRNPRCDSTDRSSISHEWSPRLRYWIPRFSAIVLLIGVLTPSVASRLPFDEFSSKLGIALYMPTYHLLFSLAIGLYTLMATTGHGNRVVDKILGAKFWKPLARLSLCVLLINIEVIAYYFQSSTHTQHFDNHYLVTLNLVLVLTTYAMATVVCVVLEAPIRGGLNHLLSVVISRMTSKQKTL